ncbi:MAG: hypothetical protein LC650_01150, partial [Actinobacteria bacterium]|nr:hypothetical protein [Actinomycetota bacterium]
MKTKDQNGGLRKMFSSLTGMLTMVCLVLGFGLSEAQAQDADVASIYNAVDGEVLTELSVEPGETFTLTFGVETNVEVNAVNISFFFDESILQIAEDGLTELAPDNFNVPLSDATLDNENGYVFWEIGYIEFLPPGEPAPAGSIDMYSLTFTVSEDLVFSTTTELMYDMDESFVGSVSQGVQILNQDQAPFIINVLGDDPSLPNDDICDAEAIECGQTIEGDTELASASELEPSCTTGSVEDVFYSFEAEPGVLYSASVTGEDYDGVLAAYTGACDGELTEIACSDVTFTGGVEEVSFSVEEAQTVYLQTYNWFDGGAPFALTLSCEDIPEGPENDECDQAIELACGETVMGTNVGASINEPCGGNSANPGAGVWYTITLEEETIVTLETCNENTDFDTDISVFTGGCDDLTCSPDYNTGSFTTGYTDGTNIEGVDCDGDFPLSFRAGGVLVAQAGVTYYVHVSGYDGTEEGMFALEVSCAAPPACTPASDLITEVVADDCVEGEGSFTVAVSFSDDGTAEEYVVSNDVNDETANVAADGSAEFTFPSGSDVTFTATAVGFEDCVVTGGASFTCPQPGPDNDLCGDAVAVVCGETIAGSNVGATNEGNPDIGFCGTAPGASGVWYVFEGTGDIVTATTCNDGTDFDTRLNVYSGSCEEFACIGGNDDSTDDGCQIGTLNPKSKVEFDSEVGETYYILVSGFGSADGNFDLSISCEEPPACTPASSLNTEVVSNDCANGEGTYTVAVSFSDDGSAEEYVVSNDVNDETANVAADGSAEFTFAAGTDVVFTAVAVGFEDCVVEGDASFSCPPANDLSCDAIAVECGSVVDGSNEGATPDERCGFGGERLGVWYVLELESEQIVSLETCLGQTNFDTDLSVFSGSCDDLTCFEGFSGDGYLDGDSDCEVQSWAAGGEDGVFTAPAGTYYIMVHGFGASTSGDFTLSVSCEPSEPVCDADGGFIGFADESDAQTVCADDADSIEVIQSGATGEAFAWVITDEDANVLDLPEGPPFDFSDAETGTVLIWYLAFDPENSNVVEAVEAFLDGAEVNAGELEGCFSLSNSIALTIEECFDCPEQEANVGDACETEDGGLGEINDDCMCVPVEEPSCNNFVVYLADISPDFVTDIYEVSFNGGDADLSLVATSETEVHIAYNEENGLIYAVNKDDGSYRTLDPATGTFGPMTMIDADVDEIIGAVISSNGKLLISSQTSNTIYSVNLTSNEVSVFDSYSPILGGDIAFGQDG